VTTRLPNHKEKHKNQLRILVDAHSFDKEYQGSRTFIKGIYTELLRKKDLLIFLAAYDIDRLRKEFPDSENLKFIQYKSRSAFLRLTLDIPGIIKKYNIGLAHFQYFSPMVKTCRQMVTIHDVLFEEFPMQFPLVYRKLRRLLFKRSVLNADLITTVSDYSKNAIQKYLNVSAKRIHIIPNGVEDRFFAPYYKQQVKDVVQLKYGFKDYLLFVSRIEPRKNHLLLLKTYLELKLYEKGYHLVFIGHKSIDVPEFTNLLNSLDERTRQYIFIHHSINNEELLEFYRAADLFVYPSLGEGFGIPPLEAAAAGVPVICSNSTAMSEYSFFGEGHFDPADEVDFRNRLFNALEKKFNKPELEKISETIRNLYSWEDAAEKIYRIMKNNNEAEHVVLQKAFNDNN
jgi:glycosyltransferase involved in cell wall biosynthesis